MTGIGPDDRIDVESTEPSAGDAADALMMFHRVRDRAGPGDRERLFDASLETPVGGLSDTDGDWTSNAGSIERPARIGRFEIHDKLGEGGFGTVFLARDPELNRRIALKVPGPGVVVQAELLRRFVREGVAAAALDHPHIVPVYEAGHVGSIHYIASAYVDGEPLSNWMARYGKPLDPVAAARLIRQLAEAVQHAHSRGILHRDLKPANVLLDGSQPDGGHSIQPDDLAKFARLTDFGLAKQLDTPSTGDDTRTNAILGTPAYMAPEQADGRNRDVGIASDVYSLGSILYELLTGRPPFKRDGHLATLRAVCNDEPTSPAKIVRNIPTDLEAVCLKCLEKDPADRYRSAIELGEDLSRFLAGDVVTARPIGRLERIRRWTRRRPLVAALSALSTVLVLALLIGSATAAIWLSESNKTVRRHLTAVTAAKDKEEIAKKKAQEKTRIALRSEFESLLSQARLLRTSGRPGQRLATVKMLKRAAAICSELELAESQWRRLRDEFLGCSSLPDAVSRKRWSEIPDRTPFSIDRAFTHYAFVAAGAVVVRRFSDVEVVARIRPDVYRIVDLKFHPNGSQIAIVGVPRDRKSGTVEVWSPLSQKRVFRTETPPAQFLHKFDYSADGKRFAILRKKGAVEIRDTEDFEVLEQSTFQSNTVSQIYLSPDGRHVAGMLRDTRSRRYVMAVIDSSNGRLRKSPPMDSPLVLGLEWSNDGERIAFVDGKQAVHVWHQSDNRVELIAAGSNARVLRMGCDPSGQWLAVATSDRRTRIWDLATGKSPLQLTGDFGMFRADGKALAGRTGWVEFAAPETYRVHRLQNARIVDTRPIGEHVLLFAESGRLVGLNLTTGKRLASKPIPRLTRVLVAPDGRSVFLDTFRSLQRRAVSLRGVGSTIKLEVGDQDWSVPHSFRHLLAGRDRLVGQIVNRALRRVEWLSINATTGVVRRIPTHTRGVVIIAINRMGSRLAAVDRASGLEIRDAASGKTLQKIPVRSTSVRAAFSPNGDRIAVVEDSRCRVFSIGTATPVVEFSAEFRTSSQHAVAYSDDGRLLAFSIEPGKIRLVRADSWKQLGTLSTAGTEDIRNLRLVEKDRYLIAITGARTRSVHVWKFGRLKAEMDKIGIDRRNFSPKSAL